MPCIEKKCKPNSQPSCENDRCRDNDKVYVVNTVNVEGNVKVCNTVDVEVENVVEVDGTVDIGNTVQVAANNLDIRVLNGTYRL